jgi:hypothetical protein
MKLRNFVMTTISALCIASYSFAATPKLINDDTSATNEINNTVESNLGGTPVLDSDRPKNIDSLSDGSDSSASDPSSADDTNADTATGDDDY